ncbi:MAG: response regulator [Bacteroidetes bacterium]|nr:response regulator [Bacteroidota bacterium]
MNRNKLYTVSLASIGVLLILLQIFSQYWLQKRNDDASLLNRAGKQLTLSEKALKELLLFRDGQTNYRDSAMRSINTWAYHHEYIMNEEQSDILKSEDRQTSLQEVDHIYLDLKELMLRVAGGDTSRETVNNLMQKGHEYLSAMDHSVVQIQYESRGRLGVLKRIELGVFLIIGLLLLLELFFVVRPLLLGYKKQNEELVNLNEELRSKQESLNENIARLEEAYQEKAELASQVLINSLVIENSVNFIGLTDEQFRISYINEGGRKMTRLPLMKDLKEKRITEVLDMDTARLYAREIIPKLRNGKIWNGRTHLKNFETNELIPVQASFFPVIGSHGETVAFACIQVDISEILEKETELQMLTEELQASQEELRVQLEEQTRLNDLIEENEYNLRLAQEIGNTGSFILYLEDGEMRFQGSEAASKIMENEPGVTRGLEEVLAKIHPDDISKVKETLQNAISGEEVETEFRITPDSTQVKYVRAVLQPQKDQREKRIVGALIDITQSKRVEERLRISEARMESAIQGSQDGIWDWDIAHDTVYFSDRWLTMLGYAPDELEQKPSTFFNLLHPDDLTMVQKAINDHVNHKAETYSVETRMLNKKNEYQWVLSRGKGIPDENGNITRMIGTHADIDTLKRAQNELDEKRSNLRAIIENTNDLVWSVNHDLNLITFNELYHSEFSRAFGSHPRPGVPAYDKFPEPDRSQWILWTKKALNGERFQSEYIFDWPTGKAYYEIYINPIESLQGISGAALYAKNITKRKVLEIDAKRQEEALKQMYDAAINISDPYLRFQKTLEIGCSYLNMDFGLINRIDNDVFLIENIFPESGAYEKGFSGILDSSYTKLLLENQDIFGFHDISKTKYVSSEAFEIFGQRCFLGILLHIDGKVYGSLNFFREKEKNREFRDGEISFLRSMGEWIERDLEAIQYQSALIKAKDSAEMAARAKADFLATMSHEIRTPLNGVLGMTSLLETTELNEEQRDFVNTIKMSGDSLLAIINDILDFSKIEAGSMELEEYPLSIEQTIGETFDLVATKAAEKGIELLYEVNENVPDSILGDVTRLRQILINLASNAVKFTDEGEILVTVRPGKGANRVRFGVKDTGIGIPQEARDKLFQAFSQVDSSTTRKYGGTGLGLAISTRLVQAMKGELGVESEVGKGSEFYFEIPVKPAGKGDLNLDFSKLKGRPICVVDDNETNVKIMEHQFKRWGANPRIFLRPTTLLETLKTGYHPDLFIVDYAMPDLDGLELARRIRKMGFEEPILMLSSLTMHPEIKNNPNLNEAISKPVKHTLLLHSVNRLLSNEFKNGVSPKKTTDSDEELPKIKRLKILLAEDNLFNQKLATMVLNRLGYSVDVVSSGKEAITAIKTKDYNLILMDIQMPEMDGTEATSIIRSTIKIKQPFIVAMTANAMEGDKEKYLSYGMDDYIPKPIDLQHLKITLQKFENLLNKVIEL